MNLSALEANVFRGRTTIMAGTAFSYQLLQRNFQTDSTGSFHPVSLRRQPHIYLSPKWLCSRLQIYQHPSLSLSLHYVHVAMKFLSPYFPGLLAYRRKKILVKENYSLFIYCWLLVVEAVVSLGQWHHCINTQPWVSFPPRGHLDDYLPMFFPVGVTKNGTRRILRCTHLNEKCLPQAHMCEHLVPGWRHDWGRLRWI